MDYTTAIELLYDAVKRKINPLTDNEFYQCVRTIQDAGYERGWDDGKECMANMAETFDRYCK